MRGGTWDRPQEPAEREEVSTAFLESKSQGQTKGRLRYGRKRQTDVRVRRAKGVFPGKAAYSCVGSWAADGGLRAAVRDSSVCVGHEDVNLCIYAAYSVWVKSIACPRGNGMDASIVTMESANLQTMEMEGGGKRANRIMVLWKGVVQGYLPPYFSLHA